MALTLELSHRWQSAHASHCDRHVFAGVAPAESDLPVSLQQALAQARIGETVQEGSLAAKIMAADDAPGRGHLAMLHLLRLAADKQADWQALASLREPYNRSDEDDGRFYARPRLVSHLDANAQEVWRNLHGRFLAPKLRILDLMASWDSHLPAVSFPLEVVGLGMNAEELAHNPRLTERIVHDLNAEPTLPWPAASFDLIICALSIEYLIRPVAVLQQARRVLRPGGWCVISFSDRWFPSKAVQPWPRLHPFARMAWVMRHLWEAGFVALHCETLRGLPRPSDDRYAAATKFSDPLYAVWGLA